MANSEITDKIHGRVDIQIGKHGLSPGVIEQIKNQFKHTKYLKIRFLELHFFDSTKDASQSLANQVNAKIVDVRGKTCVLQRQSQQD